MKNLVRDKFAVAVGVTLGLLASWMFFNVARVGAQLSQPMVIPGSVVITGTLSPTTITLPAGCIADTNVATPAGGAAGISTAKLNCRTHVRYNQPEGTSVVTESRIVWITHGTSGAFVSFTAQDKVASSGGDTVTINVLKNGTSILSGGTAVTVTGTTAVTGTITTTSTAAADYVEFVITATHTSGTLGQGLVADLVVDETPS